MDWIRLVQCLTAVKAVMITHGPYVAGNSERQAAPERGVRTMEIHFFGSTILVYCRNAEILGV